MKASVYYENGSPDVFRYEDVADPECDPNGIVIRVEAVSIEGGDTINRQNGELVTVPHIVGYQAAGEVVQVGAAVGHFKVGDRAVTVAPFGSHAELRAVDARYAWQIPVGMDVAAASVIPIPFGTAHESLFEFGRLKKGEIVLIQAGASGVGVAAIQLAAQAGASMVLATASSDARLEALKPLGMTHGINYSRDDVVNEVERITGGRMADVIVDTVGGATLQTSILSLGHRGRLSVVGTSAREPMVVDVNSMINGDRSLCGVYLGAEIATDRVHDLIQQLIHDVADGRLKAVVDRTFALRDAAEAHRYIESRQAVGRVVLIP
ncbi:NADPH:quinone reductase-like Zn-dependent oxidoreductase [Rhizobium sp. PP-CC-2G-626]|nr:NADPH:quinone reductase-like Zn-dependent oxidoreductase [Rhizobium sp. PP-CC-2G-626]